MTPFFSRGGSPTGMDAKHLPTNQNLPDVSPTHRRTKVVVVVKSFMKSKLTGAT